MVTEATAEVKRQIVWRALFWLAVLCLPFAEVATTIYLTRRLGASTAFLLYALPTAAGLFAQALRYPHVRRLWAQVYEAEAAKREGRRYDEPDTHAFISAFAAFWAIVVLLLVPGVITHAIALALMVPVVRRRVFWGDTA